MSGHTMSRSSKMSEYLLEQPVAPDTMSRSSKMSEYLLEQPVAPDQKGSNRKTFRVACTLSTIIAVISILGNIGLGLVAYYLTVTDSPAGTASKSIPHKFGNSTCHIRDASAEFQGSGPRMLIVPAHDSFAAAVCWDSTDDINARVVSPYELQVDDWWTNSGFYTVYGGDKKSFTQTELVPSVPYRFRLLVRDHVGRPPIVIYANTTLPERGLCANIKDMTVFRDKHSDIQKKVSRCVMTINDDKATKCITALGLSSACASCWVGMGHCVIKNCMPTCLLTTSKRCQDCTLNKCFPGCMECMGVPQSTFAQ